MGRTNKSKKSVKTLQLIFLIIVLLIAAVYEYRHRGNSQDRVKVNSKDLTVMFYNVENLFDPQDAPTQMDDDYTPHGKKHWTYKKYHDKLKHIAKVIELIGGDDLPDIIGLAEIEDRKVLEDLISQEPLRKANYKIIHYESLDPRGIDVALLYKPSEFRYISDKQIFLYSKKGHKMHTRPILEVIGEYKGQKVYIFVNHWKSRVPDQKETEYKRIIAAAALYNEVRKILRDDPNANIIIMGDFNDTCHDRSIKKKLKARLDRNFKSPNELYNAMAAVCKKGRGTTYHGGDWYMFDQIIVSQALLDTSGLYLVKADIFSGDDLLIKKHGKVYPNRAFVHNEYTGGVSDHLPVYAIIK